MSFKITFLKVWHDPVWSKVIAAGIIFVVGTYFWQRLAMLFSTFHVDNDIVVVILVPPIFLIGFSIFMIRRASKEKLKKATSQEQRPPAATLDIPIPGNIPRERLPEFQIADSIEALRQQGRVRPLTREENELSLWELPDNVFGYADAYKLNWGNVGYRMINTSDIEQNFLLNKYLCLYQSHEFIKYLEIHKYKNCSLHLVCYVTEEDRISLQNPSRSQPIKITVSLNETIKRNKVIAIPRERLTYWRVRILGDGEHVSDATIS